MRVKGPECNWDCENCFFHDCRRSGQEILTHEAEEQMANGTTGQRIWNRRVKAQEEKPVRTIIRGNLGERIRSERLRAGLRCKDVAAWCGVNKNTPSKWEHDAHPSPENWAKLIELLPGLKEEEQA